METNNQIPPADELASIREQAKLLKNREAELRAIMLADVATRRGNHFIASVKTSTQNRINLDKLRSDYPAIAAAVSETVSVQMLVLSGISQDGEIIPLLRSSHQPMPNAIKRAKPL